MTTLFARPYPVQRLREASQIAEAAALGDLRGLHLIYQESAAALSQLDPLESASIRDTHRHLDKSVRSVARAALSAHDAWEDVVIAASVLPLGPQLRAFCWLVAHARYLERPDPSRAHAYARGGQLPGLSPLEGAWLALLPALIGLGPELSDEVVGPCPLPLRPAVTTAVPELIRGLAPISAHIVLPEDCLGHLPALDAEWRELALRGRGMGLLVEA